MGKRINIELPDDLKRKLKTMAYVCEKTIAEYVIEAIESKLREDDMINAIKNKEE